MEGVVEAISCMEAHMTCTSAFCCMRGSAYIRAITTCRWAASPRLLFLLGALFCMCIEGGVVDLDVRTCVSKYAWKALTRFTAEV